MEELKKLEEIQLPDVRNTRFVVIKQKTGERRELSLQDIYEAVKSVDLHNDVPEDVRNQFNVARNLAIYTWFSYSFHQVSELKAFSTVEYALRKLYGNNKQSFRSLIEKAVSDDLLKDSRFSHIEIDSQSNNSQKYVKHLPDLMPKLRNDLAHGSCTLHPGSVSNLQICADFINQLFKKAKI